MKYRFFVLILFFSFSIFSWGQEKKMDTQGLSPVALSIFKDKTSLATLIKKANKGDDNAALKLGYMYRLGHQVKKNPKKAVQWFKKSANKGNAEAQLQMAIMSASGEGIKQDYRVMRDWLEKSAVNGYELSQFQLGLLYAKGITVDQDKSIAQMWLGFAADQPGKVGDMAKTVLNNIRDATAAGLDFISMPLWVMTAEKYGGALATLHANADKGDTYSQYLLGLFFYWLGEKEKADSRNIFYKEAASFFKRTSELSASQYMLGKLYLDGKGVKKDKEQAFSWIKRAAEQDYVSAQVALGKWYSEDHTNGNLEQAKIWYERAKSNHNWYATVYFMEKEIITSAPGKRDVPIRQWDARDQYVMGLAYENGLGVPVDLEQAVAWYRLAATQLLLPAQRKLGLALLEGKGVVQNTKEAVTWLELAAEQGDAEAMATMGKLFVLGEIVPEDEERAASFYKKAAVQGVYQAQEGLGILYYDGRGVNKDFELALKWLEKAATQSDTAMEKILIILQETTE